MSAVMNRPGAALARSLRVRLQTTSPSSAAQSLPKALSSVASAASEPSAASLATWKHYAELSRTEGALSHSDVNRRYVPPLQPLELPTGGLQDNASGKMSDKHLKDAWSEEEILEAVSDNVVMTWSSGAGRETLPILVRGEGVYVYDNNGKEYMDLTSQAVCVNMGYSTPEPVIQAVINQMRTMSYVYPGLGIAPIRARLCKLMAEITPGDINGFLFPLGGSEANEGAIRIARRYTGKQKIMSAARSYHGGTTGPLAATGDFRSKFAGDQPGYVKIFNPQSLRFSTGGSDEAATQLCLKMLEEQILSEGGDTIAAILLETIVGANGVFLHPAGYMEGVRGLCDKYNILLICDEVMCGFWRTGPLFAFQHFQGVIPDLLTSAKGLTSSILPLGMIGMRQPIKEYFETRPLGWGATYANHPVSLSCAYEVLRGNLSAEIPMEAKVAKIESVMLDEVDGLIKRHKCVSQGRVIGAFGCLDLVNRDGAPLNMLGDALPREALVMKKAMREHGLFGLFRSPLLHISPPLVISDVELKELFRRLDCALTELDNALDEA